jgi:hypothetical protein
VLGGAHKRYLTARLLPPVLAQSSSAVLWVFPPRARQVRHIASRHGVEGAQMRNNKQARTLGSRLQGAGRRERGAGAGATGAWRGTQTVPCSSTFASRVPGEAHRGLCCCGSRLSKHGAPGFFLTRVRARLSRARPVPSDRAPFALADQWPRRCAMRPASRHGVEGAQMRNNKQVHVECCKMQGTGSRGWGAGCLAGHTNGTLQRSFRFPCAHLCPGAFAFCGGGGTPPSAAFLRSSRFLTSTAFSVLNSSCDSTPSSSNAWASRSPCT